MRIFLHIGTHKTGSTSIQAWLASSRAHLAAHRIAALPTPPFSRSREIMEAGRLDPGLIAQCRRELSAATDRLAPNPAWSLVLSSEGFSGDPSKGYENADVCARLLAEVLAGHEVTVVVYFRSQDSFIESLYTQRIHQGDAISFPDFLASLPLRAFDWRQHVEAFARAFGQEAIRVRPFHESCLPKSDSILRDFCQLLNCPFKPAAGVVTKMNPGYSRDALELALAVNPMLDPGDRRVLRGLLQRASSKGLWRSYSYFTPDQRAEVRDRYAASNEDMARTFLGATWETLYPAREEAPPYSGLTPHTANALVAKLLVETHRRHLDQLQAVNEAHQAARASLEKQLRQSQARIAKLETRLQPLLESRETLGYVASSRLLRRIGKWEAKIRHLWRRVSRRSDAGPVLQTAGLNKPSDTDCPATKTDHPGARS
jgi:hypothetical protein